MDRTLFWVGLEQVNTRPDRWRTQSSRNSGHACLGAPIASGVRCASSKPGS